jgi:hypothetical protein
MRARHRHFKFGAVEKARLVLDSRYIHQSDDTEVSPWSDRSGGGNDVSQATSANRPKFQTAEQGGNGVVRFDGSNDVLTRNEITISSPVAATAFLYIKRTSSADVRTIIEVPDYVRVAQIDVGSSNGSDAGLNWIGWADNGTSVIDPSQGVDVAAGAYALCVITYNGGTSNNKDSYTFSRDGTLQTIVQGTAGGNAALGRLSNVGIGGRSNNTQLASVDIGFVGIFGIDMASPLRKRCEHANAFAFKHSCN